MTEMVEATDEIGKKLQSSRRLNVELPKELFYEVQKIKAAWECKNWCEFFKKLVERERRVKLSNLE